MGPERRSSPFKTTRLVVKLHQAYVLASVYETPFYFESVCNSLQEIWNKKFAVGLV